MTETVKELVEKAKEQFKKGDSPANLSGEINFAKATVLMLLALHEQNEEMIAQNKKTIEQNEMIIKYSKY